MMDVVMVTLADIQSFYKQCKKNHHCAYINVADQKKVPKKQLLKL